MIFRSIFVLQWRFFVSNSVLLASRTSRGVSSTTSTSMESFLERTSMNLFTFLPVVVDVISFRCQIFLRIPATLMSFSCSNGVSRTSCASRGSWSTSPTSSSVSWVSWKASNVRGVSNSTAISKIFDVTRVTCHVTRPLASVSLLLLYFQLWRLVFFEPLGVQKSYVSTSFESPNQHPIGLWRTKV